MKVWVLTREINQYDQDGSYFEAVFLNKPTAEQLEAAGVSSYLIGHTLRQNYPDGACGGRTERLEDEWWNLEEVEVK